MLLRDMYSQTLKIEGHILFGTHENCCKMLVVLSWNHIFTYIVIKTYDFEETQFSYSFTFEISEC